MSIFLISIANKFSKKKFRKKFWFWCQIVSFFSGVTSLMPLRFLTFSIVFPKTALFINLKMSFSIFFFFQKFVFLSISIYGFNQAFWLNLMILRTFFDTQPWFNAFQRSYVYNIIFFIMQLYCKFLKFFKFDIFREKG